MFQLYLTVDTVTDVARGLSGGTGTGGTDSVCIQNGLL